MFRARERKGVHEELALRAFRSVAIGQQVDPHAAMGERRSLLDSLGNAPRAPLADHDAVDHDLDGMPELLIEFDGVVEGADLVVDAHAREAFAAQVFEELGELTLAVGHHGREHEGAPPHALFQNLVRYLVGGLALDLAAAFGAVRRTDAREEQAQVVVDLRDCTHRGARILGGGLLIDGHGRAQAIDGIEVRLVHLPQEHPGIGAQGLHIPPLALGIDRVKSQGALAGAREARHHHQLVPGDCNVNVFEVVGASAFYDDLILHREGSPLIQIRAVSSR